jgi:hypothetical protein
VRAEAIFGVRKTKRYKMGNGPTDYMNLYDDAMELPYIRIKKLC